MVNVSFNETYICLISEKLDSKSVVDYRPISLISLAYKIPTWVLPNRLTCCAVVPSSIAENQLAFVANRQIIDASLMANELIDDWTLSHRKGVVLKLDLEKASDTVDCNFLDVVLHEKGCGSVWCK